MGTKLNFALGKKSIFPLFQKYFALTLFYSSTRTPLPGTLGSASPGTYGSRSVQS